MQSPRLSLHTFINTIMLLQLSFLRISALVNYLAKWIDTLQALILAYRLSAATCFVTLSSLVSGIRLHIIMLGSYKADVFSGFWKKKNGSLFTSSTWFVYLLNNSNSYAKLSFKNKWTTRNTMVRCQ